MSDLLWVIKLQDRKKTPPALRKLEGVFQTNYDFVKIQIDVPILFIDINNSDVVFLQLSSSVCWPFI